MNSKEAIYVYNLSNLDKVEKVQFVQALKGRGSGKGIIDELKGKFLAPGCFIIPENNALKAEEVFKYWKVKFKKYSVNALTKADETAEDPAEFDKKYLRIDYAL